jgi:hypothetical protein
VESAERLWIPFIINLIRLGFWGAGLRSNTIYHGLSLPYIQEWVAKAGVGWAYGMMAYLEVGSFLFILLVRWKGLSIGGLSWSYLSES